MRNIYVALEDLEHNPGQTVYIFTVHKGNRHEAKKFRVTRDFLGQVKMGEGTPPGLQSILLQELREYDASLHREGV